MSESFASDPWGNVYPPECTDLSDVTVDWVVEVDRLPVIHNGESRCGLWKRMGDRSVIYLLRSCDKPRAEVLKHELCHEQMWRQTGDPRWHD